jgi:serine/threonine-protein kinase
LNILHRDISLQNLLVGVDGVCRVADFGAAKSDLRRFSTDQNYLLGKLLYMPPEYLRRDEVGVTLDIYSLGITLWHLLTGGELWEDASEAQVISCIIEGEIPPVSATVPVPPQLDALVAKATHVEPQSRFQSAKSMARTIEALGRETGWLATHSEVAEWARALVSHDLDERRKALAIASARRSTSTGVHGGETDAPPPPVWSPWSFWALLALIGLAGVGAVAVFALRTTEEPHAVPDGVAVEPAGSMLPSVRPADPVEPAAGPLPSARPADPVSAASASAEPPVDLAPPPTVRTPPKARPEPRALRPRAVKPADELTTKNPYR